jgi:hypothetical protein
MKQFQEQNLFQPAAQSQGFEPVKAPDVSGLLRQNNQARLQEAKMFADQRMADLKLEEQSLKYQELLEREEVGRLADFSQTLSDVLVQQAEARNEREEQRGLMLAYTDGIDPQDAADFDAQEATLEAGTGVAYAEASKLQAEGLNVDAVKSVRNLTGWAKYGYMRGLAEQGGANYGTFYTQAAQNLEVTVNGNTFTLMTASNGAERAAAKAAIAEQYMQQYAGMNPALLNKYLFPKMKSWERADDLEWAEKQRKSFEDQKESEFHDMLFGAINTPQDMYKIKEAFTLHQNTFGNRSITNQKGFEYLGQLAEKGLLTQEHVDEFKQLKFLRSDTGKEDFASNLFARQIAVLEQQVSKGEKYMYNERQFDEVQEKEEFESNYYKARDAEFAQNGGFGENFTAEFEAAYKAQFPGQTVPDYISKDKSIYDRNIDADIDLYQTRMEQGKPLTEQDFMNMHPGARAHFIQQGVKPLAMGKALELGGKLYNKAQNELEKQARTFYGVTEGSVSTQKVFNFTQLAMREYERAYNALILDQDTTPFEAHRQALRDTVAMAAPGKDSSVLGFGDDGKKNHVFHSETRVTKTDAERKAFEKADMARFYFTKNRGANVKIPNLENDIKQLDNWVATGKGGLPAVFKAATLNTSISPWTLAEQQYKLYTGKDLVRPTVEGKVEQLSPQTRRLLQQYSSPNRTMRAALAEGGPNKLAELTGLYESDAFGGYDAMNEGGSGEGLNNRAYGSANSKDVFDRGLSDMTVDEVMDLQRRGKVFAAGRYQFIPETLAWVVRREGLPTDGKFDKNFQDYIWAAQVRWRLENYNSYEGYMPGLKTEWQGLHHADEYEIRGAVKDFKESPFNDPRYLHPALIKKRGNK